MLSTRVSLSPSPYASTRAAMAAFAAMVRAILPRCHLGAECIRWCWKSRPCFGGSLPDFMDLKSAFSAPSTCMVLDGIEASFCRLPARESSLAATTLPSTADRLGASSPSRSSRCDSSERRASCMPTSWPASSCAMARLPSDMSPPLLLRATSSSICAFSSGKPASRNDCADRSERLPHPATRAYPATLSTRFSSSGKCSPYHSRSREPRALEALSISSSAPMAWTACRSALPDISATRADESESAKSRRRAAASRSSEARPASTMMDILEACTRSASAAGMCVASIPFDWSMARSAPSLTSKPAFMPSRCLTSSLGAPSPRLTARYCPAGSEKPNAFAGRPSSSSTMPSSVSTTECMDRARRGATKKGSRWSSFWRRAAKPESGPEKGRSGTGGRA